MKSINKIIMQIIQPNRKFQNKMNFLIIIKRIPTNRNNQNKKLINKKKKIINYLFKNQMLLNQFNKKIKIKSNKLK